MKAFLSAAMLAAVIASPATAQTVRQGPGTAHPTPWPGAAAAPGAIQYMSNVVISAGQYIGSDPDPQVRLDLARQGANYTIGGSGSSR